MQREIYGQSWDLELSGPWFWKSSAANLHTLLDVPAEPAASISV